MLRLRKITFSEACDFVDLHHRHHKPPRGHKFSLGVMTHTDILVGVAICGRAVSRHLDARGAWEVTRLCTTGERNACSFLYAACAREVKKRGGKWVITYILQNENGASLRAAGWIRTIKTPGRSWSVKSRPRDDKHPLGPKWRYEKYL